VPGRVVGEDVRPHLDLEHGRLPDPLNEVVKQLHEEQEKLKEQVKRLEETSSPLVIISDRQINNIFSKGAGI
ncbi:MAG: serine O-acetyltransferase, partial [Dehalococcoidia bacterium]|nr:serine O-acetyltransferase [Dehalococcoidia bacterium]